MILRIQKRENPYAQIDNRVLNDSRLSWKARGILAYLLSKPDNWKIVIEDLISQSPDGRDAIRSGMRELTKAGYLELVTNRDESGKMQGKEYVLHETPQSPSAEKRKDRTTGFPSVGKSPTNNTDNKTILKNSLSTRARERKKSLKKSSNIWGAKAPGNLDERFNNYLAKSQVNYPVLYSNYSRCKLLFREEFKTLAKYIALRALEERQQISGLVYNVHEDMNSNTELIGKYASVSGLLNNRLRRHGFLSIPEMSEHLLTLPVKVS